MKRPRSPRTPALRGPAAPVLQRLRAEKGLLAGDWWPFLVQEEGKALPGGLESLSGYILTRGGEVFGWWLDWDAGAPGDGDYAFDRWWRVARPEREFAGDGEYRRARERLRLQQGQGQGQEERGA
jgi:hypothetical protein